MLDEEPPKRRVKKIAPKANKLNTSYSPPPPVRPPNYNYFNHELTLKDRNWTCKVCGVSHDRDILASNNIKQIGLVQPESKPVESDFSCSLKQETADSLGRR